MHRLRFVLVSFVVVAAGCARGLPAHSLARYARSNSGEQVRLVGAVSGGYTRETEPGDPMDPLDEEDEALAIPLAETGGTYRLHEMYSGTVTASAGILSVEGLLRFGDPEASIGVIHGAGIGLMSAGDDPQLQLNLIGGVFAQLGIDAQNFILLGGRYVFDDLYGGNPGPGAERGLHWIGVGAGWLGQLFNFFGIGVELHGGLIVRVDGGPTSFFLLPTVTLNAAF